MTAKEMMEHLLKMSNSERNAFLNELYESYFRTASDEELIQYSQILEAFFDGRLIYAESED